MPDLELYISGQLCLLGTLSLVSGKHITAFMQRLIFFPLQGPGKLRNVRRHFSRVSKLRSAETADNSKGNRFYDNKWTAQSIQNTWLSFG